jgi:hypothetical protein
MLVQTLVENGIKYGVATLPKGGEISLKSQVDSTALKIQVTNSGQFNDASNGNGVGLKNSRERLKLLFGEAASVTVQNTSSDSCDGENRNPNRARKNMKTFIVDDERLARSELRRLLKGFSAIEIIGEAANADEAIEKIETARPDLLFLDIQMPGRNGFRAARIFDLHPESYIYHRV